MRNATSNYIDAINQDTRTFYARLLYNGVPVAGDIKQITVTQGATFDGLFAPGAVFSPYIEATIDNCPETLQGKELRLEIGLQIGESIEYLSMGYYTVGAPKTRRNTSTFLAHGRITSRLSGGYFSSLSYPATIANVLAEIGAQTGLGITLMGGLSGTGLIVEEPSGYLHREMIGYIAGLLGGFATEDSAGGIVIAPFPTVSAYSLTGDRYYDFPEVNDLDYICTGIKVIVIPGYENEDGSLVPEVAFSTGTPNIITTNPFMTQALFDAMHPRIVGYSYRPGTVTFLGDNRIEPWDLLSVADGANTFSIPAMGIVFNYDGGLTTSITSPGTTDTEASTEIRGPLAQQVDRIFTNLLVVEEAVLNRLKVEEAEITYATIQELIATNARVETLEVNQIDVAYIDAHYAKIDLANIADATIKNAMIESLDANKLTAGTIATSILKTNIVEAINASLETAKIGSAKINVAEISSLVAGDIDAEYIVAQIATLDSGFLNTIIVNEGVVASAQIADAAITNAKIADLSANKINAGTLSVERLLIGGAEGGLLFALNNYGELVSTEIDSLDGGILTPRTITADRIVAGSISADEIGASAILANHISTGAITAEKLSVGFVDVGGLLHAKEGLIGAFLIGNSYIASGTNQLGFIDEGQTGSVYIGADGISCGDKFKVDSEGNVFANGLTLGMFETDVQDFINGLGESATLLETNLNAEIAERNAAVETALTDAKLYSDEKLNEYQASVHQFLNFTPEDGLILGQTGSVFNSQLTNNALNFREGSTTKAYVSATGFHLVQGVVDDRIKIGNIALVDEDGALNFMVDS